MENLKQFGNKLLFLTLKVLVLSLYLAILIGPLLVIRDETLMVVWVCFATLLAAYTAVLHSTAITKEKALPYLHRLRVSVREATKKFLIGLAIMTAVVITVVYFDQQNVSPAQSIPTYTPTVTYSQPSFNPATTPTQARRAPSSYIDDDSYKYNYRAGNSSNYSYNYDVSGSGNNGYTYGNIDTSGKYGEGYIYDEEGNEIYVETEWVDYGVMEATDEFGNTYELEVE